MGVIIHAMHRINKEFLIKCLQNNVFVLATDASNDIDSKNLYGLAISFYDEIKDFVHSIVLSLLECTDNTVEGILKLINAEFMK